jgi:DNA-binding LytR/AlgR family response regulator
VRIAELDDPTAPAPPESRLVSDGGRYWMDPTLNELEQRLAPDRFCRISRAALVNLNAVAEVHPLPGVSGNC